LSRKSSAPSSKHLIVNTTHVKKQKKKQNAKKNVNSFRVWACVSHTRRQQTDLLIVFGTFSEDMMTTGIPFSLDDSCMQMAICNAAQNVSTVLKLPGLKEKDGGGSYLDLLEELVPGHLRHPVVSDDQAHTGLLQQTSEHVSTSHIGTQEKKSKDSVQHCKPRTNRAQQLQRPLPAVHGRHCKFKHGERFGNQNH
jgi:hypothetical protein